MDVVSRVQRKNILGDPVTEYLKQNPQASEVFISELGILYQQYSDLSGQLKDRQLESKKISRLIGEAKREARPSEDLVQAMQKHSAEAKILKGQLKHTTERILSYFEASCEIDKIPGPPDNLPPARVHKDQSATSDQLSITQLMDDHDAWNRYVESNPGSSLYHRSEWKNLIHNVFGHECYYFYASYNNEVVGVLPLVRLKSRLFGDFMVSMPYFNSGGALANSQLIEQQLMRTANDHAEFIGTGHIEYRDDIRRDGLPVRDEKVNMILSLPDKKDTLWNSFSSKLRSQIRRTQRENTTIEIGGADCLDSFYSVFAQNMRDLGTPVYGKLFFSTILQRFSNHSNIVIVRLENRPVAAAFLLGHRDTLEIPWASTIKEVNHLSLNMLLYWEVLQFAIENHFRYFDFGRSSKDSGTFHFKQQWGAKPKQCYWHYWLPENVEMPKLNPDNPKYSLAISIWKKLPIFLTKLLGPYIVRNLP